MNEPGKRSGTGPAGERPQPRSAEQDAEAEQSGYPRDDYWRAAQEDRPADAGAQALKERDAAHGHATQPDSGPDREAGSETNEPDAACRDD